MEDKSFSWILRSISHSNTSFPILPTYIVREKKAILFFSNKDHKLNLINSQIPSVKFLLSYILDSYKLKTKLQGIGSLVCYIITTKERIRLSESLIKQWIETLPPVIIKYVQPALHNSEDFEVFYILRLEYTQTSYISHFFKQINFEKVKFYDPIIFDQVCDIGNSIMALIESNTKKRVMILEIEFLEDLSHNLWISFFREIKIAEPIICTHFAVKNTNDLKRIPVKSTVPNKFSKLANGEHVNDKNKSPKPPIDYTFAKGHIRNKKSNLGVDLSIKVPNVEKFEGSRSQSKIIVRSMSIKKSGIRSSNSQPRETEKLQAKRAKALRDEIMKSPELKSKFKLAGLIGVIGVEVQKEMSRSHSDSNLLDDDKNFTPRKIRPKSRLILKYKSSSRIKVRTPK